MRFPTNLRAFAERHDHLPAFHAGFLVLALLAATLFNLGFFALLIALHMALDTVKFHRLHGWKRVRAVLHESLIELTLFCTALAFSVYVHHSAGMVAFSAALRAEVALIGILGVVLPKYVIVEGVLKILAHWVHALGHLRPCAERGFTHFDRLYIASIAACLLLLLGAPALTGASPDVIGSVVLWELSPLHL
jgi:hypothetical protein